MKLLPAIDLVGGRCVRLSQGDFSRATHYSDDPWVALESFAKAGAEEVHIVDLDGARAGEPRQHDLLKNLATEASIAIQVAGGFRTGEQVASMLDSGARRVVIGSLALSSPDAFRAMLDSFGPERLTLALDVRLEGDEAIVATHGWMQNSGCSIDGVMRDFPSVRHVLVTDIARDGMLAGPNIALIEPLLSRYPRVEFQASGGVANITDVLALKAAGAARAIVGKAIWERRFSLEEALSNAGC